ncbi:hypothetical protein F5Y08DRAFT_333809 [Xylaria arbuscula]|nr:hypothetical protein F5Y08DRAFT_333809 [Xylaria arbuscula]
MPPSTAPQSRSTSEEWRRQFYDTSELGSQVPNGFPSLAVGRASIPDTATFRTFEYLDWRQLHFYETKITYLEKLLFKLDIAEDKKIGGSQRTRVPFDKKFFDNRNPQDSGPLYLSGVLEANEDMTEDELMYTKERLFGQIEFYKKKHRKLISWIQKSKTFTRVGRQAHGQLFRMAQEVYGLDNEALDFWRAIDEMAYVSIDSVELWIRKIQLSAQPLMKKIFQPFDTGDVPAGHNGSIVYQNIEAHGFKILRETLVVLFGLSSVLVPGGLLVLGGLSKSAAFGIVAVFGAVFAFGTTLVESRIGHIVVVIIAYLAVLATFLSIMS